MTTTIQTTNILENVCIFLAVLGLHCCMGFSLVALHRLLITVTSPVAEHGLSGTRVSAVAAHGLKSCDSGALEHRLNCCGTQA